MDSHTLRILDASLNRAAEGLRVVEDYARFVLGDRHLAESTKTLRHELALAVSAHLPAHQRHTARDTQGDVGTAISTPSETARGDTWHVCAASLKRVQQSLRSLEEYGKLASGDFAARCEQLRYRVYTLEKAMDLTRGSLERLSACRVCVLVEGQASSEAFGSLVGELVEAGAGMIQLRDKQLDDRALLQRAKQLVELTRGTATQAIVNDRVDIAAASHADGVHLGQDDMPVAAARAILSPGKLIGISTHELAQARQAVMDGADYLGAGPTFPSRTKQFHTFAGLEYLRQLAGEVSLPVFAIGGIDAQNVSEVAATGIARVAVASCVTSSDNPKQAVAKLNEMLQQDTHATVSDP